MIEPTGRSGHNDIARIAGFVLALAGSLGLSATIATALGDVLLNVLPCRWFGTSSEGACGYGALWFTLITMGALAMGLTFGTMLLYVQWRRRARVSDPDRQADAAQRFKQTSSVRQRRYRR